MASLAELMVKVGADISGFTRGMKDVDNNLKNAGKSMQNVGKSFSSMGSKLTKSITVPAMAAATALGGLTIGKGFARLVGIDTAKAKLKALGHDADSVKDIMNSALDSVRGTSFGLEEAATTAASAVAAGVKPGKDLTRYLSITGDAAAIAGVSMSEMGSIFNKVQTAQKAYTAELNQLADRGIPIYQWLAEEAGVTAEEVRDMASEGQISSEMFLKAIEKNIGGASKVMGEESFMAALANIGASIGRIGANFLDAGGEAGGFFSTVKPMLTQFRGMLEGLEGKAATMGVKFGQAFITMMEKIKQTKQWFDNLSPSVQALIVKIVAIASSVAVGIGPLLMMIGKAITMFGGLTTAVGFLISPVGLVIAALVALGAGFTALWITSEAFRNTLTNVFNSIKAVVMQVLAAVVAFVGEQVGQIKQFWIENGAMILQAVSNVWNAISPIIDVALKLALAVVKYVWSSIKGVIEGALNVIMGLIKIFAGLFTGNFSSMWEGVKQLFSGAIKLVWNLMNLSFVGAIKKLVLNFGKYLVKIIKGNWDTIVLKFLYGKDKVMSLLNALKALMTTLWNAIKTTVVNVVKNLWSNVQTTFNTLKAGTSAIFNAVRSTASSIWNGIKSTIVNLASTLWNAVRTTFNTMKSTLSTIFSGIRTNASNAFSLMKSAITTTINGIKTVATTVFNAVKTAITHPIETAKTVVLKAVDSIKSAFNNMKLKIPKPKIPKVTIGKKKDAFFGFDVPSIKISWNAKGGIFNGASLLGGGQGVGEAGAEAVLPIQHKRYMRPFASAVAEHLDSGSSDGGETVVHNTVHTTIELDGEIVGRKVEKYVSRKQADKKNRVRRNR